MKKILLVVLLASGCSSGPVKQIPAPLFDRLALIKGASTTSVGLVQFNESEALAADYLKAKAALERKDKVLACKLFEDLSRNTAFPLNQTALVHALTTCSFSSSEVKRIWEKTTIAPYLKEAYLDASVKLAQALKLQEAEAEFSYESISFKQSQTEKVKLLKKSISLAQALKSKEQEEKYFKRLTEISPSHLQEVLPENIYSVARDYESSRQFDKARVLYLEIINGEFTLEEKIKAYNSYRMSYKVDRDLKTFLLKTAEMESFLKNLLEASPDDIKLQEAWVEAKITYARAVWTEHQNKEARQILEDILFRQIGSPNQLATLYWVYGSLHIESKEILEGLKKYEKATNYTITTPNLEENLQWAIVWNKYQLKNDKEVIADADKFIKKSNNNAFIHKLNFWKAKTLLRLERAEEALELFKAITLKDSFGYYGLISSMETQELLAPFTPAQISTDPSGDLILDWLIAVEEKVFSAKVLKEMNSQFKTTALKERAMSLYAQTEWYQGGMLQIFNFPMKNRDELTQKYINVVYPTPNKEIVDKFSLKYKVPAALIYAITRQESSFNPNARSWADAFGLMQLIPEKGSELGKRHNIPYKHFEDLYKPELNVELGTALLSELREKYDSKFISSVAAYNASTNVIAVWERERFNGNYLEFIEMIPYEETRNYVKHVFKNYITYKRILENQDVIIPKIFFEIPFN
jgi:soluble lytic murein transglycosylase